MSEPDSGLTVDSEPPERWAFYVEGEEKIRFEVPDGPWCLVRFRGPLARLILWFRDWRQKPHD